MLVVRYSVLTSSMSKEPGSRLSVLDATVVDRRFRCAESMTADRVEYAISDRHCATGRTGGRVGRHHNRGRVRATLNCRSGWNTGGQLALYHVG